MPSSPQQLLEHLFVVALLETYPPQKSIATLAAELSIRLHSLAPSAYPPYDLGINVYCRLICKINWTNPEFGRGFPILPRFSLPWYLGQRGRGCWLAPPSTDSQSLDPENSRLKNALPPLNWTLSHPFLVNKNPTQQAKGSNITNPTNQLIINYSHLPNTPNNNLQV